MSEDWMFAVYPSLWCIQRVAFDSWLCWTSRPVFQLWIFCPDELKSLHSCKSCTMWRFNQCAALLRPPPAAAAELPVC